MYPKINDLVRLLHSRGISTFLVTNAQFPDAIKYALDPLLFNQCWQQMVIINLEMLSRV